MASTAKIPALAASLALSFFISSTPVSALSQSESDAISGNCSTIHQSLKQLQKSDSKTRMYLGTTYETIANKFITPLNLRLVRNNRPTFSEIQTNFSSGQSNFRNSYTSYMREMESLLAIDCRVEPAKFYDQLIVVREHRAKVRSTTEDLKQLTHAQSQSVATLRKELK